MQTWTIPGAGVMRWGSASSDSASLTEAIQHAAEQVADQLNGEQASIVIVFVSFHHAPSYYSVNELVRSHFPNALMVGCSGGGVIGGGREIERRTGVAICAAILPGVAVRSFQIQQDDFPSADAPPEEWRSLIGVDASETRAFMLLADPASTSIDQVLAGLDYAYPDCSQFGGVASAGSKQTPHALFEGGKTYRSGLVGVALSGDISVDTIVAQGCRPVGEPMMVTKSEGSIVQRLGDATPMEILKELFNGADKHDKWLIRRGLHVGIVVDRFTTSFSGGDFLIRNVIGLDQVTGGIKVSDVAQEGQIVQFHLRDAATARADLAAALQQYVDVRLGQRPEAALLFSNIGRGHHLYREADHDTNLFREIIAPVPLTGLFCNGEIGPIGESTFLHGYTSSFALISRRGPRRGSSTPGD